MLFHQLPLAQGLECVTQVALRSPYFSKVPLGKSLAQERSGPHSNLKLPVNLA